MAKSINQVTLMGNLTRHPEVKQIPSGNTVAKFSLALNRSYKDGEEWKEATDYVDVEAWGKLAEQVGNRLTKGSRSLVQGRLKFDTWDKDGIKQSKLSVLAQDVTFLEYPEPIGVDVSNGRRDDPIDLSAIPF